MKRNPSARHERQPSWDMIEPLTLTKEQYQATYAAVKEAYAKGNPPFIPDCAGKPEKKVAVAAPKEKAAKKFSKL